MSQANYVSQDWKTEELERDLTQLGEWATLWYIKLIADTCIA